MSFKIKCSYPKCVWQNNLLYIKCWVHVCWCCFVCLQLHQTFHQFYFWPTTLASQKEQEGIDVTPCENSRAEMCRENNVQPAAGSLCVYSLALVMSSDAERAGTSAGATQTTSGPVSSHRMCVCTVAHLPHSCSRFRTPHWRVRKPPFNVDAWNLLCGLQWSIRLVLERWRFGLGLASDTEASLLALVGPLGIWIRLRLGHQCNDMIITTEKNLASAVYALLVTPLTLTYSYLFIF